MKTSHDPRHIARVKKVQALFAWEFNHAEEIPESISKIITKIPEIDLAITESAPQWPINKINRMDLSILREAIYELLISKDAPIKVVVDEAVEIAKTYGSDASPSFVNGALGKLIEIRKLA